MKRRHFLRTAGLSLTLPALESFGDEGAPVNGAKAKRLFLMTDGYGFHTPFFYPAATGKGFPSNDVIAAFDPLREHVSILGGLKHMNGHASQKFVATGSPKAPGFGDSVDQLVARHISREVPVGSLLLC